MLRVLPLVALAACVAPSESDVRQSSDVVVEEPTPVVDCSSCSADRVAGEEYGLDARWQGRCKDTFGQQYDCLEQEFTLTAECVTGSCVEPPATTILGWGGVSVTTTTPGAYQVRASIDDLEFTMPAFHAYTPDTIEYDCHAGPDHHPCTRGVNPEPVDLAFYVVAGGRRLVSTGTFTVETTATGNRFQDNLWQSTGPGVVTGARYGDLAVDINIRVGWPQPLLDSADNNGAALDESASP